MKKQIVILVLGALLSVSVHAHRAWLLPTQTVFSGNEAWLTVDAAIANGLFYFDHVPMRLNSLEILTPSGQKITPENVATGKLRSVFDVHLKEGGTYRLSVVNQNLFASYKEKGEKKRWRGTSETFAQQKIAEKDEVKVSESLSRIETFVSLGTPDNKVLTTPEKGLAMNPITHPNDLAAGEDASFRFTIDGKPAVDLEVEIVEGGTRYRDTSNEKTLKTDKEGIVKITWPNAGMYFVEASTSDKKTTLKEAEARRLSYSATLEVLP